MNARLYLSFMLSIACIIATATPLSRQQALIRVQASLSNVQVADKTLSCQETKADEPYYIFSSDNSFVIASGDDRFPAVLGYSNNSSLNRDDMPPALKHLLRACSTPTDVPASPSEPHASGSVSRKPILPLVRSTWGQEAPFNRMCPRADSTGTQTLTGSVATALAQVMRFHTWPYAMDCDIPAYVSDNVEEIPELKGDLFPKWKPIKFYYHTSERDSTAVAVAQFMTFCCQAVKTNFGYTSSAATSDVVPALTRYFQYAPTARYVQRQYFSAEEWAELIYNELFERRPVIYRASNYVDGGHAFVCDGIDKNGMFHINWGWHGKGDGYFDLACLNPEAGSNTVINDGFDNGAAMVIGIQPNRDALQYDNPGTLAFYNLMVAQPLYSRDGAGQDFAGVTISGRFTNCSSFIDTYDFGFALCDDKGRIVKMLYSAIFSKLLPNYGATRDWNLDITGDIAPGHYKIMPMSRLNDSEEWHQCIGGSMNHVDALITPTSLTLTPMGNSALAAYTIDNVHVNGTMQAGRVIEVLAQLTNTGMTPLAHLYLLVDGHCASATQCAIETGSNGEIALHCTPHEIGEHTLALALDEHGSRVLWSESINVTEVLPASITCSVPHVADLRPGRIIANGTLSATTVVTNTGNTVYDDDIVARVYRRTFGSAGSLHGTRSQHVTLAPGEGTTLTFNFEHLMGEEDFYANVSYYNNGKLQIATSTQFYTMLGDLKLGDLNGDRVIDITDTNLLINEVLGREAVMDYEGRDDANNDGFIDVSDINKVTNIIQGRE